MFTRGHRRLLGLARRHTRVDAFVFSTEPVGVAPAASVPEDAALLMLSVVEPILLPSGTVLTLVTRQLTHRLCLRQVVYHKTTTSSLLIEHSSGLGGAIGLVRVYLCCGMCVSGNNYRLNVL